MDYDTKYNVTIQGQQFTMTQSQIEFDSPNYFTTCFLGEFREAQTHCLELYRDPDLFRIILTYLCGYHVLPLSDKVIPPTMSPEIALTNLRTDAAFYQLSGLVQACDEQIEKLSKPEKPRPKRYVIVGIEYVLDEEEVGHWDDHIISASKRTPWKTYADEETLAQAPLGITETPQSMAARGYQGLAKTASIEAIVSKSIEGYDPLRWKLIGWSISHEYEDGLVFPRLIILLEDLGVN